MMFFSEERRFGTTVEGVGIGGVGNVEDWSQTVAGTPKVPLVTYRRYQRHDGTYVPVPFVLA